MEPWIYALTPFGQSDEVLVNHKLLLWLTLVMVNLVATARLNCTMALEGEKSLGKSHHQFSSYCAGLVSMLIHLRTAKKISSLLKIICPIPSARL